MNKNELTEVDWFVICDSLRGECRRYIDEFIQSNNVWQSSAAGVTANKLSEMAGEIERYAKILAKIDPVIMDMEKKKCGIK